MRWIVLVLLSIVAVSSGAQGVPYDECGFDQSSIEGRIQDCAKFPGSSRTSSVGVRWDLVARRHDQPSNRTYEVWIDSWTGLLWGARLDRLYSLDNFYSFGARYAVEMDVNNLSGKVIYETACLSDEGKRANVGITERQFGLPSIEEFKNARAHGMRFIIPDMEEAHFVYWSTSLNEFRYDHARIFYGATGESEMSQYRQWDSSVRCVGR